MPSPVSTHQHPSSTTGFDSFNPSQEGNFYNRTITWITKDRPFWEKCFVYSAVAMAAIALTCSFVGIPVVLTFLDTYGKINQEDQISKGDTLIFKFFNAHGFGNIPSMTVPPSSSSYNSQLASQREDFPSIRPTNCKQNVMSGTDHAGRPFIALKLKDKRSNSEFVQIIRRTYSYGSSWCTHVRNTAVFSKPDMDSNNLEVLSSILNGSHPQYSLAR